MFGQLRGVVGGCLCAMPKLYIQVFGLDGSFVREWARGEGGEGQFDNPFDVAVSGGEAPRWTFHLCGSAMGYNGDRGRA